MDTVTKTGIDTVIQKTAEAKGDLVGNKIAYETTSLGKTKSKEKEKMKDKKSAYPQKKDNKLLMT